MRFQMMYIAEHEIGFDLRLGANETIGLTMSVKQR